MKYIVDVQIFLSCGRVVVSEMEASAGTVERRYLWINLGHK